MMADKQVGVGVLGLGTVGGGVVRLLREKQEYLSQALGAELVLKKAVDMNPTTAEQLGLGPDIFSQDAAQVLENPDIQIVVEMIGGLEPARTLNLTAIAAGKQLVTANKALLAHHGAEIFTAAREKRVGVAFEASVGGGIPLIRSIREGLKANQVDSCLGILNGTCNYILTRMASEQAQFQQVLREAQSHGYAEADPSFDVEGTDTAHKLAILAALLTGAHPEFDQIFTEGISQLTLEDLQFADEFGFKVKLLAILRNIDGAVEARVHPALVPKDHVLASVDGPFNALHLTGDWVGDVLLYGQGAGSRPTASAVVGDILDLARDVLAQSQGRVPPLGGANLPNGPLKLAPVSETTCQYYFRISALDQPGVLAAISRILAEHDISIEAVLQKGRRNAGPVPIVILTHEAKEAEVQKAIAKIDKLPEISRPTTLIRKA